MAQTSAASRYSEPKVTIRMSAETLNRIAAEANRLEISVADYMRMATIEKLEGAGK